MQLPKTLRGTKGLVTVATIVAFCVVIFGVGGASGREASRHRMAAWSKSVMSENRRRDRAFTPHVQAGRRGASVAHLAHRRGAPIGLRVHPVLRHDASTVHVGSHAAHRRHCPGLGPHHRQSRAALRHAVIRLLAGRLHTAGRAERRATLRTVRRHLPVQRNRLRAFLRELHSRFAGLQADRQVTAGTLLALPLISSPSTASSSSTPSTSPPAGIPAASPAPGQASLQAALAPRDVAAPSVPTTLSPALSPRTGTPAARPSAALPGGLAFGRPPTPGVAGGLTARTALIPGTGALAPATASPGAKGEAQRSSSSTVRRPSRRHAAANPFLPQFTGASSPIERIVGVVPGGLWAALAASLVMAAGGAAAALRSIRRARRQAGQFAAASAAALTDPLTGVLNRRGFTEAAERELARARRYDRPLALAFVDVRGLKAVNDTEGHLAGDQLLRGVAHLLTDSARADDLVGRIGGDELALLLAEQSTRGAATVTERIRAQVSARRAAMGLRAPWDLTIGTASYPADGETLDELLATADRRLYEQRGIELRNGR